MNRGREVTAGAVIVGAIALLALCAYFFLGWGINAGRYTVRVIFPVAPVQKGDNVRLAGVLVGEVATRPRLTDDNRAEVTIALDRDVKIRRNYKIEVTSGILVGANQIDITPVKPGGPIVRPGETLEGAPTPQLADLIGETRLAVSELRRAAESVTGILSNKQLTSAIEQALQQATTVGQQFAAVGQLTQEALKELMPSLKRVAAEVATASAHVSGATAAIEDTLADPTLKNSLTEATQNLASASDHLDKTVAAVQKIAEAPEFGQDVKTAVKNAGEALQSIKQAADGIQKASDAIRDTAERAGRVAEKVSRLGVSVPKASGSLNVERLSGPGATWVEANANLDIGNRLLRIGLADVGGNARVNLQLGREARSGILRMGLIQSELGVGYDLAMGRSTTLSVDLFDPGRATMNVLGYRSLAPGYEAVLGMRDVGRENRVSVGVRATR